MADEFDQGRYAYVTLLSTTDYLDAVLVLNKSLQKVNSKYPLLAMVVDTIFTPELENCLRNNCIVYEVVSPLSYCQAVHDRYQEVCPSVLNTASKLQIFSLKNWDKLVYIDADALVIQNIDDLFDYPDGSMLKYPEDAFGFTGLFVCCPRRHHEEEFYPTLLKEHLCLDGDLIGKLWFFVHDSPCHQIPTCYFTQYDITNDFKSLKAIHYCNSLKPWIHVDHEFFNQDNYVCWLYKKYLNEVQQTHN